MPCGRPRGLAVAVPVPVPVPEGLTRSFPSTGASGQSGRCGHAAPPALGPGVWEAHGSQMLR